MIRHGSERFESVYSQLGDVAIENKMITKQIEGAQRRVEGINFDIRKSLLEYDDVLRQQREIMYDQRNHILENNDVHTVLYQMFQRVVSDTIGSYRNIEEKDAPIDYDGLVDALRQRGLIDHAVTKEEVAGMNPEELQDILTKDAWEKYEAKIDPVKDQFVRVEKDMVLNMIDRSVTLK